MDPSISLPGIDTGATPTLPTPEGVVTSADAGGEAAETGSKKKDTGGPEVVLRARERFEYVLSVDSENRKAATDDMNFAWVRGAQWNEDNRKRREAANPPRPWLEFNQTGPYVKRITNDQRKNQPSIKVRPAGGGSTQKIADMQSGLIRAIESDSQASAAYDTGNECAVTGGRGYWRLMTDWEAEDSFNQVAKIGPLPNPSAVFLDPDAKEPDKSDIQYGFICDWLDEKTYEREWPKAGAAVSWSTSEQGGNDEWSAWFNANKICVADYFEVCEYEDTLVALDNQQTMWKSDYAKMVMDAGDQHVKALNAAGQPGMVMPPPLPPQIIKSEVRNRKRVDWYKVTARDTPLAKYDWLGKFIPIVMVVGDEINIDGKRIYQGVIRRLRDAQMMYNYAYTMMVERVALAPRAPYVGAKGQFENLTAWETLNTENHPYLEYNIVQFEGGVVSSAPQRTEPITVDQGLVTILQLCSENLRAITGQKDQTEPNPQTPWRALVQSAKQGDLATFHYGDNLARAIALTGRMLVDLNPKIYDSQRTLRMISVDGKEKQEVVNQQIPSATLGGPPTIANNITTGRYDVTVETGPSYATRRVEAASEINEFMVTIGPEKAGVVADIFAEMADWPGEVGQRVARRLKALLPPQVAAADDNGQDPQIAMMQQQLQQLQGAMQQMHDAALAEIKKRDDQIAELKVKVQGKGLDFLGSLVEADSKRDDAQQSRLMAAEGNASDEFIAKIGMANDISQELISMGLPAQYAGPILAFVSQLVGKAGQTMRRGPDFSDVANALTAAQNAGNESMMGAVQEGAQQLSQPPVIPAPQIPPSPGPSMAPGPQPGPPSAPAQPGGNGGMPPGGNP